MARDYAKEVRDRVAKHGKKAVAEKRKKHRHARLAMGLRNGGGTDKRVVDHKKPLNMGGSNHKSNLSVTSKEKNLARKRGAYKK
jgi:hypothetical protein